MSGRFVRASKYRESLFTHLATYLHGHPPASLAQHRRGPEADADTRALDATLSPTTDMLADNWRLVTHDRRTRLWEADEEGVLLRQPPHQ